MKKFILTTLLIYLSLSSFAQSKTAIRAVWLTSIYGLDWPHIHSVSPSSEVQQKKELCDILDNLKNMNINVVLFQARIRGDVAYNSDIEPYNDVFTGREGGHLGYDPLAYVIDECHKRGMECHAWMVTMPLGTQKHVSSLRKASVVKKNPAIISKNGDEYYLNPSAPGTVGYLAALVREVVSKYDVDGIQFDYLRYPEQMSSHFDAVQYAKYGHGEDKSEWRRNNITSIVRVLYNEVKSIKPWVKVSTCPIGKYRDVNGFPSGGFNAYHAVYQDPQRWMREGIQDIIFPMMYYRDNNFYPFAVDWQEHSYGRYVVPALGVYFLDPNENKSGKAWSLSDINSQIKFIQAHKMAGEGYFRTMYLQKNTQDISTALEILHYATPALTPPMRWQDSIPPSVPTHLQVNRVGMSCVVTWNESIDNDKKNIPTYIVYGSDKWPVDVNDPRHILALKLAENKYIYNKDYNLPSIRYFAVTALDRYGNESMPVQMSDPRLFENILTPKL